MRGIRIVCVGKIKEDYLQKGISYYLKNIRRYTPIEIQECPDEATPDKASPAQEKEILRREGERILRKTRDEDYIIALSIDGKEYDTPAWASRMKRLAGRVSGDIVYIIGGSLGLSAEVIKRADEKVSFSAMTFPHQLMRLILCEQIERIYP